MLVSSGLSDKFGKKNKRNRIKELRKYKKRWNTKLAKHLKSMAKLILRLKPMMDFVMVAHFTRNVGVLISMPYIVLAMQEVIRQM